MVDRDPINDGGMELELKKLLLNFREGNLNLTVVKRDFLLAGGVEVNFGFNLARQYGGADLFLGPKRILFFSSNPNYFSLAALLAAKKIPVFREVARSADQTLAAVDVPPQARALDSIQLREQGFMTSYLGAFEVMAKTGEFLAQLQKKVGQLPEDIDLSRIALSPGEVDFIKLIPPFKLSPDITIEKILKLILDDLNFQDPSCKHDAQVEILRDKFYLEMKKKR